MPQLLGTPLVRSIGLPLAAFAGTVLVGIGGFVYLGGVGVVVPAFWLLDPTSIELHGAGTGVKAYALLVFAGVLLSGTWIGETVLTAAFGGQIRDQLRTMQQDQRIDALEDHFVVCGYGMLGRTVASELAAAGEDVVVVEREEAQYTQAIDDELLAVNGDARRDHVLSEAGVDRSRAVIATVDDSNANIQTAIVTSQLAPHAEVTVRVGEKLYEPLARRAGADTVIIPEVVSGKSVLDRLL